MKREWILEVCLQPLFSLCCIWGGGGGGGGAVPPFSANPPMGLNHMHSLRPHSTHCISIPLIASPFHSLRPHSTHCVPIPLIVSPFHSLYLHSTHCVPNPLIASPFHCFCTKGGRQKSVPLQVSLWSSLCLSSVLARIFIIGQRGTRCTVYLSMSLRCFSALCRVACKRRTTDRQW